MADSEFAECIRGENGKCAKHPGITAAAVMDEVTQCIYKTCDHEGTRGTADFRSNPPSNKCTLLILKFLAIRKQIFFFFTIREQLIPEDCGLHPWGHDVFSVCPQNADDNTSDSLLYSVICDKNHPGLIGYTQMHHYGFKHNTPVLHPFPVCLPCRVNMPSVALTWASLVLWLTPDWNPVDFL